MQDVPDVTVQTENLFQLKATITRPGKKFAFYLYFNDEVAVRTPYGDSNTHKFPMRQAGVYRVKGYVRTASGDVTSWLSARVRHRQLPDVPATSVRGPFAVMGVTLTSAFASHVLSSKGSVSCFVDPTAEHVGTEFFGLPVVAHPPLGTVMVGHENYESVQPGMETFSLSNGAVDVLSRELHRHSVMDLYRLSRSAYLEGFDAGAYHIQGFIFNKFNSRVPFLARIGHGTRLGIGGIGVVIHPDSIIGTDCVIAQNVTLGSRARGNGTPIIGNNVFIAPGAKCFGGKIGDNVVIGANAVVLDEVPDNCVVAGVPAKIISRDISKYTTYIDRPPRT